MEPTPVQSSTGSSAPSGPGARIISTPETCGGKPRIAGHRIAVKYVVLAHQRGGMSPDEIVSAHPGLTLADVHAALAYYFDHRDAIDADIRDDDGHWSALEAEDPGSLADRLRRRKSDVADHPLPSRMRTLTSS
jgi:uncharacterized protein (DUF433 family)